MGQKQAAYDVNGNITAFYDTSDSPAPDGTNTLDITDDQWQECLSNPGYTVTGGALVAPVPLTDAQQLANSQPALCAMIDATADAVYIAIGGPSPGRLAEYEQAKSDALAYQAANWSGNVPATVQCWATASNITAEAAAQSIIATATAWENVLTGVRSARLIGKAAVNAATTTAAAQAAAQTAVANVQAAASAASGT